MITVSEKSIIVERACSIIFSNEGDYGSINKDDNGAVSIGKVQWHGCRALDLLKTIVTLDNAAAQGILGDSLYNEIFSCSDWNTRILDQSEADKISNLLTTRIGMQAQDSLASVDVLSYINKGLSYGLTNTEALIFFADGVNQYGTESQLWKNIVVEALKKGGGLDAIFDATNRMCSSNLFRRATVYEKLKQDPGYPPSVSEPIDNNIRIIPDSDVIKTIQKWCNDYRFAGIIVDGVYGPQTKSALIQCLQYYINNSLLEESDPKKHSLNEDGLWGAMTESECPYVSIDHNQDTKLAYIAQALLYANGYDPKGLDSIFGPDSVNAAKLFQTDNNLTSDGAVGALTFAKLVA